MGFAGNMIQSLLNATFDNKGSLVSIISELKGGLLYGAENIGKMLSVPARVMENKAIKSDIRRLQHTRAGRKDFSAIQGFSKRVGEQGKALQEGILRRRNVGKIQLLANK
jgi:hypothetical protein